MGVVGGLGKATRGYDPSKDIAWLRSEIVRWIQGNLLDKWWVHECEAGYGIWTADRCEGAGSSVDILQLVWELP